MDCTIETPRLLLRPWKASDLPLFAAINADERVMEHFPRTLSQEESDAFAERIVAEFKAFGWGLYAVELKSTARFIGYCGFHNFSFEAEFSPGVEIGWRLGHAHWHHGYATEAALACLEYARSKQLLDRIYSFTSTLNRRSERVMEKIGMERQGTFKHPLLPESHPLQKHVLYRIEL